MPKVLNQLRPGSKIITKIVIYQKAVCIAYLHSSSSRMIVKKGEFSEALCWFGNVHDFGLTAVTFVLFCNYYFAC